MTYNEYVVNFIKTFPVAEPIFIEDLKAIILDKFKNENINKMFMNVNVILNRLVKADILKTFYKGIYYKPKTNMFGEMTLNKGKVIKYKYLEDRNGNVKGYIYGAKLFNILGLTTQVPNTLNIATNECNTVYAYKNDYLNTIIKKPKIMITNDNYLYLQLFDILENKDNINIEVDNADEIIANYIQELNLDYKKIITYAYQTNNLKLLEKLAVIIKN